MRPTNTISSSWSRRVFDWTSNKKATTKRRLSIGSNRIGNVVKEYARYCTLHGVQYVFKDNSSILERIVWLAIVLTSFVCASLLMNTMWTRFSMSPTMTAVKDTHLPLHSFPFSAVSVCPADKIKKHRAYDYLSRYINLSISDNQHQVDNFLAAMSMFQHPLYSRMNYYMEKCADLLPVLSFVNLTDFMLAVTPTCRELFNKCYWIGQQMDCCKMFNMQRTEEGFCYSFNSLTPLLGFHCPPIGDIDGYGSDGTTSEIQVSWHSQNPCWLRRNTAAGSFSGLEVYLKSFNSSNRIVNASEIIGVSGTRVQVFYVAEYPEAGMGSLVMAQKGLKLSTTVKPFVTISTEAIRHLSKNDRFCYFPDEQHLSITRSYTQRSCLIECRLRHLKHVCNCRPYYFNSLDNKIPICNASQMGCIADHSSELRFFSPPSVEIRGFNDSNLASLLNCSQCLPTCHETIYDIDTAFSEDTSPLGQQSYGTIDIFYRNEGAVKYQRDVTFGWIDLLVSFGGIAGLFLGFSLLSIVEFVYWGIKLAMHQLSKYWTNYGMKKRLCHIKHLTKHSDVVIEPVDHIKLPDFLN